MMAETASDDVVILEDLFYFFLVHPLLVLLGRGEEASVMLKTDILCDRILPQVI
jgi:hypothetical protein